MSHESSIDIYCIRDMKERCWKKKCPECGKTIKKDCIADNVECKCGYKWHFDPIKNKILEIALVEQEKMC